MPAPRTLELDDFALLDHLAQGMTPTDIGKQYHVSRQAVKWRLDALKKNLPAPAARRADETLAQTLNAIQALHRNQEILEQVRDACLRQLEGPNGALEVGPHETDVEIVVSVSGGPPQRKRLADLLAEMAEHEVALLSLESKHADPRTLLLSTLTQIRSQVELAVRLTERIHDAQQLALFQQTMIEEIERADPETAARIKSRLHEARRLRLALTPPALNTSES